MKMPNFSKMTVDALLTARSTIDNLLKKRLPGARKELEMRLSVLSNYLGGESKRGGRKSKADGRSKLKGRKIAPKYRGRNGETWSGRGIMPRWLSAAIKGGADLEDFAIGAGRRKKGRKSKKASVKSGKKRAAAKKAAPKRKATKLASEGAAASVPPAENVAA